MRVEWFGQSAFSLTTEGCRVFIDPFGDIGALSKRTWEYPPIAAGDVDLVLISHEHIDHNGLEAISGQPEALRAAVGRHETAVGEVVGIASEHDAAAGTERGPNAILCFELDSMRVAHFGDFGQAELRPEQRRAIGEVDLLFLPVGGGPTIDGAAAAEIALALNPAWVVPMHYRTPRISFLETEKGFTAAMPRALALEQPWFETADLPAADGPLVVVPAVP